MTEMSQTATAERRMGSQRGINSSTRCSLSSFDDGAVYQRRRSRARASDLLSRQGLLLEHGLLASRYLAAFTPALPSRFTHERLTRNLAATSFAATPASQ